MTQITGHLVHADGQPAEGHAVVFWPAFTVYGNAIAAGLKAFEIFAGDLVLDLLPNGPAQPAGTYYTVRFELQSGAAYEEYWIVPDTPSVTLEQIRVSFPVAPDVAISPMQLTGGGATPGEILTWNGQRWMGQFVSTENLDPNHIQFAVDAAGADFTVTGTPAVLGGTAVFHLPSASPSARGLVTAVAQTFGGNKTFTGSVSCRDLYLQNTEGAADIIYRLDGFVDWMHYWWEGAGGHRFVTNATTRLEISDLALDCRTQVLCRSVIKFQDNGGSIQYGVGPFSDLNALDFVWSNNSFGSHNRLAYFNAAGLVLVGALTAQGLVQVGNMGVVGGAYTLDNGGEGESLRFLETAGPVFIQCNKTLLGATRQGRINLGVAHTATYYSGEAAAAAATLGRGDVYASADGILRIKG